jgi:hypothetical protein
LTRDSDHGFVEFAAGDVLAQVTFSSTGEANVFD